MHSHIDIETPAHTTQKSTQRIHMNAHTQTYILRCF